ncbi:hypothetical protein PI23P_09985 [Polaribacter irgensii 23-P]|uniref:Lipoprotein n=1 Tax=Polaribacter irgensii 23-P TaxID=313594 RepID=A4C0K6_9FLAO|nr:DUF4374 domain-containing protein [Polaribacter irgensii]EAR12949.1 hypothetical protein PI23P_09985 [Polaribacter irgensii 23-P]
MKIKVCKLGLIFTLICSVLACNNNDDTITDIDPIDATNNYKYLLALSLPTTDLYPFHVLEEIESGTASIYKAQEIPDLPYNLVVNGKDGYVYLNSETKLTKYEIDDTGVFSEIASMQNTGISGGPVSAFLPDNKMIVSTGARSAAGASAIYQIIDLETMTEDSTGSIVLPSEDTDLTSPSLYIYKDNKLFVPYFKAGAKWAPYDTASIAIYNIETLELEKVITTDKAAGLGFSVVSSHAITENGDLYITSSNTNYWVGNESIPSGIVKINAGESEFDDYFFDLSAKFNGNHTGGMVYAGNNKAIVQVFRSDLITKYADYQGGYVIEYHSIDLTTKETTKLDIPISKYPRNMMQSLGDGRVAIIGNTETEGNNVYIYDETTRTVTKGLEYNGTEMISAFLLFK